MLTSLDDDALQPRDLLRPLLVMDVWKHAFLVHYKPTERGRYIEAFFANVNWPRIEGRFVPQESRKERPLHS